MPAPGAATAKSPNPACWDLTAFGVSVRSELPVVGATPASVAAPGGHTLEIRRLDDGAIDTGGGETVLERRIPDGSIGMRVGRLADGGYVIEAPGHGTFAVDGDGLLIHCCDLAEEAWRWHRPLCAQALPLAATLQGFELFHASAVALGERAFAFVATSGTGKTSLATHLTARGAELLTDDVLSLECRDGAVIAHPGVHFANIAVEQIELLSLLERARLGTPIGRSEKLHLELSSMPAAPLPLSAVFFLERSEQIERLAFERVDPPDFRVLLGATFMPHIVTPGRLSTQLHTCAEIAAGVPTFRLRAPSHLSAPVLAAAVEEHAAGALA